MKTHKQRRITISKSWTWILLVTLFCSSASAQSIELDGVTKMGFKGLRKMDEKGYYVQYQETIMEKKRAVVQIRVAILDNDLKPVNDFLVPLRDTETVEDVAYNDGKFMVITSSNIKRTRTFTTVDQQGNQIATKEFDKVLRRLLEKPAVILPYGNGDFVVINYLKEKKVGYSVERYGSDLEMKYSKVQIPDRRRLYPVDFFVSGDRVYVLEFITPDLSDYFEYHIASYDAESGDQTFKVQLKDPASDASGFATFIKPTKDGGVVTGGMYFNGNRTKAANSDGFFASTIGKDGSPRFSFVDWKQVKDQLKDKGSSTFFGGTTKTFMHDIAVKSDGSFTLIGENYRRGDADLAGDKGKSALAKVGNLTGGGSKEEAVTVADYALMDFSPNAEFIGIRKLDEAESITVIKDSQEKDEQPYVGQKKGLNLANILNNNGYFPYRFYIENGGNQYLVSVVKYEQEIRELLFFTKLNSTELDTTMMEVTSSELRFVQETMQQLLGKLGGLGKLASKMNKKSGESVKNEFELKSSHDPFDYRAKATNTRIIPSNVEGKVLIYDFIPEDNGKKGLARLANMQGKLRISYIDGPSN